MPKFSIIIPVYNVAPYLRKCLDSVLAQTFTEWEAICVDDGSTDGSGAILDEYKEKVEKRGEGGQRTGKLVVIHQKNAGVSAARNAALETARGEWILFLDGDDTYHEELLGLIRQQIVDHPEVDAVGYGVELVKETGIRVGGFACAVDPLIESADLILAETRKQLGSIGWQLWNKAYRRSVIEQNHIRFAVGMKNHEDSLFSQMFLSYAGNVALVPRFVGYRYLIRSGSAVNQVREHLPEDPFRQFRELHVRWLECRKSGLCTTLKYLAAELLYLGKGDGFAAAVRWEAIVCMIDSCEFRRRIVPFLIMHGTVKSRLFAVLYFAVPKFLKKKLLRAL